MIYLSDIHFSGEDECPYIQGRSCRFSFFFAAAVSDSELEDLLSKGWRVFGAYYFRPACDCSRCIPVRTIARNFTPSKSIRRVMRINSDIDVTFEKLSYSSEIYEMYRQHSLSRFQKEPAPPEEFIQNFYTPSAPSLQSLFRLHEKLVAAGILHISSKGLSSVYFVFLPEFEDRSLGIFGMAAEILQASKMGLEFYYPGYYIVENGHMNYKNRFTPVEYYDFASNKWSAEVPQNG